MYIFAQFRPRNKIEVFFPFSISIFLSYKQKYKHYQIWHLTKTHMQTFFKEFVKRFNKPLKNTKFFDY